MSSPSPEIYEFLEVLFGYATNSDGQTSSSYVSSLSLTNLRNIPVISDKLDYIMSYPFWYTKGLRGTFIRTKEYMTTANGVYYEKCTLSNPLARLDLTTDDNKNSSMFGYCIIVSPGQELYNAVNSQQGVQYPNDIYIYASHLVSADKLDIVDSSYNVNSSPQHSVLITKSYFDYSTISAILHEDNNPQNYSLDVLLGEYGITEYDNLPIVFSLDNYQALTEMPYLGEVVINVIPVCWPDRIANIVAGLSGLYRYNGTYYAYGSGSNRYIQYSTSLSHQGKVKLYNELRQKALDVRSGHVSRYVGDVEILYDPATISKQLNEFNNRSIFYHVLRKAIQFYYGLEYNKPGEDYKEMKKITYRYGNELTQEEVNALQYV